MPFSPITDSHTFPDKVQLNDSVEIIIKINGGEQRNYTKIIDTVPEGGGKLIVKLSIEE